VTRGSRSIDPAGAGSDAPDLIDAMSPPGSRHGCSPAEPASVSSARISLAPPWRSRQFDSTGGRTPPGGEVGAVDAPLPACDHDRQKSVLPGPMRSRPSSNQGLPGFSAPGTRALTWPISATRASGGRWTNSCPWKNASGGLKRATSSRRNTSFPRQAASQRATQPWHSPPGFTGRIRSMWALRAGSNHGWS
jgi:hypothetical protein